MVSSESIHLSFHDGPVCGYCSRDFSTITAKPKFWNICSKQSRRYKDNFYTSSFDFTLPTFTFDYTLQDVLSLFEKHI